MNRKSLLLTLIAVGIAITATSAAFNVQPMQWLSRGLFRAAGPQPAVAPAAYVPVDNSSPIPGVAAPDFRTIVQRGAPAVVGVTVAGLHKGGTDQLLFDPSDPFFQFFRGLPGFQWRLPGKEPWNATPFRSQGSGFIISKDGHLLKNAHVVREASEVVVKLNDRREFKARVLGSDTATDIAVLKIDALELPTVRLGDAQQLQVGDPVLAIGSPFGFEQTATQGIVSAKGRSLPGDASVPFIQTDVAVNPGNSGGPLFDGTGGVVGINAQIYSQSGGYQGLSFAIPINVALKIKDQILATGAASHARLGVTVQDMTPALAESFGLDQPDGALVVNVAANSAAAGVGLMEGDVVIEFKGEPIVRSADLSSRISMSMPGDVVEIKIWRDHQARRLSVKLGRADEALKSRL